MSTAEIKLDLINRIANLQDPSLIDELKRLLDFELANSNYIITDAQRQRLIEAATDKVISEETANSDIEKWLSEK